MSLSEQEILSGLADILHEEIGTPLRDVQFQKQFSEDLNLTSPALLTVFATVRERFVVDLPDSEVLAFQTVGDAVAHLQAALG